MQKISRLFIDNINNLPIWVKQVMAKEVSNNLINKLGEFSELVQSNTLFQYMLPTLTLKGKHELENKDLKLSDGYYLFLQSVQNNEDIFEITVKNSWALADSAKILCKLVDMDLISIPNKDMTDYAIAQYLANRMKTGEFLKRIGKINTIQLNQAIDYQKTMQNEGRHVKMASVLIKMGYISDKGLDSLLLLKEESKRRLAVGTGLTSIKLENNEENNSYTTSLQREIARLESENLIMKKRLRKFLNIND